MIGNDADSPATGLLLVYLFNGPRVHARHPITN
nr:MAG TPA: hypothetical protein [Caudoviricetes sp.]